MSTVENPLENKYEEYLSLLEILCGHFDNNGEEILALPISTSIRVLVHDTSCSTSLLKHLNRKCIKFLSTNSKSENSKIHLGLVRRINVGVKNGAGGEAKYWPLCNETYFPMPEYRTLIEFNTWWSEEKIFVSSESSLTRKDLILAVANKDGGAHFDTNIQKKYDDFRHSWSGGSTLVGISSGKKRGYDNIPTYPAIRQIGYELLATLRPTMPELVGHNN
jgi:hypothetical protein